MSIPDLCSILLGGIVGYVITKITFAVCDHLIKEQGRKRL